MLLRLTLSPIIFLPHALSYLRLAAWEAAAAAAVASYRMKRLVSRHRKCPSLRLLVCSPSPERKRRTGGLFCVTDSALLRVFAPLIDGRAAVPSLLYFVHDGFTPSLSPSAQAPSPWSATARASSSAEDRRSGCSADGATGVPRGSTTAAPGLFVEP